MSHIFIRTDSVLDTGNHEDVQDRSAEGIKQIEKHKALLGCKQLQDSIPREI
jgi:hypothetical protein